MPLQGGAHRGTGAMQQHALVAVGQLEGPTGLVGGPALDVAQRDDEPLGRWKSLDRVADDIPGLARQEALLRASPGARRARPAAWEARMVGGEEAIGIDRGFAALGVGCGKRREGVASALAHGAGAGDVRGDAEDPGLQRRAAFETVEALQDAEPRLLHD